MCVIVIFFMIIFIHPPHLKQGFLTKHPIAHVYQTPKYSLDLALLQLMAFPKAKININKTNFSGQINKREKKSKEGK